MPRKVPGLICALGEDGMARSKGCLDSLDFFFWRGHDSCIFWHLPLVWCRLYCDTFVLRGLGRQAWGRTSAKSSLRPNRRKSRLYRTCKLPALIASEQVPIIVPEGSQAGVELISLVNT